MTIRKHALLGAHRTQAAGQGLFTGFTSADGESRKRIANSVTIAMGPICFLGLAVTSHAKSAPPPRIDPDGDNPLQDLCAAVFDSIVFE
jgi:hypothetical protein